MGFYYGAERFRNATGDSRPVMTLQEYSSAFQLAMSTVLGSGERSHSTLNLASSSSSDVFVRALVNGVRRSPTNPTLHRLLGAALLNDGNIRASTRHLGMALRLLLADARGSLEGSLCARLEIRLLLIPLISIVARSGRPALLSRMIALCL
jgi:hypothetical protein